MFMERIVQKVAVLGTSILFLLNPSAAVASHTDVPGQDATQIAALKLLTYQSAVKATGGLASKGSSNDECAQGKDGKDKFIVCYRVYPEGKGSWPASTRFFLMKASTESERIKSSAVTDRIVQGWRKMKGATVVVDQPQRLLVSLKVPNTSLFATEGLADLGPALMTVECRAVSRSLANACADKLLTAQFKALMVSNR